MNSTTISLIAIFISTLISLLLLYLSGDIFNGKHKKRPFMFFMMRGSFGMSDSQLDYCLSTMYKLAAITIIVNAGFFVLDII